MAGKAQKSLVTQLQANTKMVRDNRKAMDRAELEIQCSCIHKDANGAFALIPQQGKNVERSKYTGAPYYICRLCGKKIDISRISDEDIERAIDVIDRQMDISKMALNLDIEKVGKMKKTLGKLQYKVLTTVKDVHAVSRSKKQKKHNHGDSLIESRRS